MKKNNLEKLMQEKGLNMYELAKLSGVSYSTVHKYTCNTRNFEKMPLSTAWRFAKALGITIEELYDPDADKSVPALQEGWNEIDDMDIFVEDGKLMRGVRDNKPIYPYLQTEPQGFDQVVGIPKERYNDVTWA